MCIYTARDKCLSNIKSMYKPIRSGWTPTAKKKKKNQSNNNKLLRRFKARGRGSVFTSTPRNTWGWR